MRILAGRYKAAALFLAPMILVALMGAGPARAQGGPHTVAAPSDRAAASAKPAKPSSCELERRKTARAAQRLQRQQKSLHRLRRSGSRSTALAKRRVGKSRRLLRRQEARGNRACGIQIEMKLAPGAVEALPSAVATVSGDPDTAQTVVLESGAPVPPLGGYLVVDATSSGPGILGTVTARKRLSGGRTSVSLRPASLDQAYQRFDLRFDDSLGLLAGSPSLLAQEGATASAQSSATKLFTCKGPQIKKPAVTVDLSPLRVSSEIDVWRRYVHFLISGKPVLRLRFDVAAGANCHLNSNAKVFIPVVGPVGIELTPVLEVKASANSDLDFEMSPRIAVGFERGGSSGDQDFRVFNPNGGPAVKLHGQLGVEAFAGGAIGVSVGGRAGVRGKFGPAVTARSSARPGQICADINGALRLGLDAYANVFIADFTINLAKGEFLTRSLYSGCIDDGQGGGSGDGGGAGGSGAGDSGDGSGAPTPPAREGGGGKAIGVAAGDSQSCAVLANGEARCWGAGGSLGNDGLWSDSPVPLPVSGLTGAVAITAGGLHSCALRSSGALSCWGRNWYGQVGDGTIEDAGTPRSVAGIVNAVAVNAGNWAQTCAILAGGGLRCWGSNFRGMLGIGLFTGPETCGGGDPAYINCSKAPVAPLGIEHVKDVAGGGAHVCAALESGEVKCWGDDEQGQLGDGRTEDSASPVMVSGIDDAIAVAAGLRHSCALLADGAIDCWGEGSLGSATVFESSTPVRVEGISSAIEITAGGDHTCALLRDGEIECWGNNYYGELGHRGEGSGTPVPVASVVNAKAVSAGFFHTCALLEGGSIKCWGRNQSGQLGDGTLWDSPDPVAVVGIG